MALEDGDYGGAFATNPYLDPAMGRIFAENPEAMIPHLVEAGVTPQQFEQQLSKYAANTALPSQGTVGDQNIYSPAAPLVASAGPGGFGTMGQRFQERFGGATPPATPIPLTGAEGGVPTTPGTPAPPAAAQPSAKPIPTERITPSTPGAVPPEALGKSPPAEDNTEGPYTPSPQYATETNRAGVSTGGEVPLPGRSPQKPESLEDKKSSDAAKSLGALAGVRAPPAPPQPQLRPFAGERPGAIPQSGLVQLLAQAIAGDPRSTGTAAWHSSGRKIMGGGLGQSLLGAGGGTSPGQGNAALTPIMAAIQAMSGGMPRGGGGPAMPGMPGGPQVPGANPAPLVPDYLKYKPPFTGAPQRPQLPPNPQVMADEQARQQMLLEQQRIDAMNRQGAGQSTQDYNNVGA